MPGARSWFFYGVPRRLILVLIVLSSFSTETLAAGRELTPPRYSPALRYHSETIASNGEGFLAMWSRYPFVESAALDHHGRRIGTAPRGMKPGSTQLSPFGPNYLVAHSPTTFAEIAPDGSLVREMTTPSSAPMEVQAVNGRHILALTRRPGSGGGAQRWLLDENGRLVAAIPRTLQDSVGPTVVVSTADGFAVISASEFGSRRLNIRLDGTTGEISLGDTAFAPLPRSDRIVTAATGNDVALMWRDAQPSLLRFALVRASGEVMQREIQLAREGVLLRGLEWDGVQFVAVFQAMDSEGHAVFAQGLDRSGQVLGKPVRLAAGTTAGPGAIAFNGKNIVVLIRTPELTPVAIEAGSNPLKVVRQQPAAVRMWEQAVPALATDGLDILAVWVEADDSRAEIRSAIVPRDGSPIAGEDAITTLSDLGNPVRLFEAPPVVRYGAGRYLMVWREGPVLLWRFLGPDARPLGNAMVITVQSAPSEVFLGQLRAFDVQWTGSGFVVAWPQNGRIWAGEILGDHLQQPRQVSPEPPWSGSYHSNPRLVWDGFGFLLFYSEWNRPPTMACMPGECVAYPRNVFLSRDLVPQPSGVPNRPAEVLIDSASDDQYVALLMDSDSSLELRIRDTRLPSESWNSWRQVPSSSLVDLIWSRGTFVLLAVRTRYPEGRTFLDLTRISPGATTMESARLEIAPTTGLSAISNVLGDELVFSAERRTDLGATRIYVYRSDQLYRQPLTRRRVASH